MSRFEELQSRLEELSPIPVNMPKLYLLGDTGAGKTTIVRKILGTEELKFPSVQQKRTTVSVTEYVISKDLPYKATYLFKTEIQISDLVSEIIEIAIENSYLQFRKNNLSTSYIIENLQETPDERFRLHYILTAEQLEEYVKGINEFMPSLDKTVKAMSSQLQSKDEEINVVIEMAMDAHKEDLTEIKTKILTHIQLKVSEVCDGHKLFSGDDYFQHSSSELEGFISKAKLLLLSKNNSISPVVEYARLQGNLLAHWLPQNTELVLIDGEGIGHDTREASRLSARHFDYFHFADFIGLVEECKKPFASGGKSAIEGIIRNGYSEKLNLVFTKLDEVEVDDDKTSDRDLQIKAVKKGLKNVKNALKADGAELEIGNECLYYLSNLNGSQIDSNSIAEINRLIGTLKVRFEEAKPQFVQPSYDFEMLSSYLSNSSDRFTEKWNSILKAKNWQTVKAFNRRMCWKWDEFRDMKPVSDFHSEVTKEMDFFISNPKSWIKPATASMQQRSIAKVKQEFSKQLLEFARKVILKNPEKYWEEAMLQSGGLSTTIRKDQIQKIIKEILPEHRNPAAIKMKDSIKQLLARAIDTCLS